MYRTPGLDCRSKAGLSAGLRERGPSCWVGDFGHISKTDLLLLLIFSQDLKDVGLRGSVVGLGHRTSIEAAGGDVGLAESGISCPSWTFKEERRD